MAGEVNGRGRMEVGEVKMGGGTGQGGSGKEWICISMVQ